MSDSEDSEDYNIYDSLDIQYDAQFDHLGTNDIEYEERFYNLYDNFFEHIPDENVIFYIFDKLTFLSLSKLSTTSKNFYNLVNSYLNDKIIERYHINSNLENNNNNIKELEKRIDLLEQNYIDGNIIGLSEKFITIKCKYGEISIHKSQLNKEILYGKNMNKMCKFKLKYHINKYQGKDLILL
tara:strand:+ start:21 stop:569 length:549 start_codon:yes stop_codon:yes gene_type:complete